MTQIWRFRRLRNTPNIFLKYKTRQSWVWRTDEVVVPNLHLPGLARITYGSGIYWIHDYLRKNSHKIIPAVAYLLKFIKSCVTKRPVFDTAHGRKKTREAYHIGINGHLLVLHFGNMHCFTNFFAQNGEIIVHNLSHRPQHTNNRRV